MPTKPSEAPDLLTGLEAQQILDASLDMLDALECLVLYQAQLDKDDFGLDVWKKALAAVKRAGGVDYSQSY